MIRSDWLTIVAIVVLCLTTTPLVCAANSDYAEKIDGILSSAGLKSSGIPGAAVLVINNGEVVFERGYGVTDLKSLRRIDARTNFRLASDTKQFTAMAIMLLVHDGKLKYDEALTDIFPDFPAYGRAITVRMLLNHTSGLQDYEDLMPPINPKLPIEQVQIQDNGVLDLLKHQNSTKFPPGTKWEYSNSGYVLLGTIVKAISGQSFPQFLRKRIFAPLQMTNTVAYVRGYNDVPNRAFGHTLENGTWEQTDQSPTSATLGDGGIYSSLEDLAKWDRALRENALLSRGEMQAATTPVNAPGVVGPDGAPAEYGFGWFLNPYHGHARMWHYGETVGFRSAIQRFTDDHLSIIVLCNRADLNPSAIALQIADLYLNPPDRQQ
ncbi:MAG TPA: serine hydrolase domain-containing protein [Terriglobales bacterium]|nr:serine hydrolase domain-containing protein [Terriglobales bacterium]